MTGTRESQALTEITQEFTCTPELCAIFAFKKWKDTLPKGSKMSSSLIVNICRHQHQFGGDKKSGGCGQSFTDTATNIVKNSDPNTPR